LPRIDPVSEALTTLEQAGAHGEPGDDHLRQVAERRVDQRAAARTEMTRQMTGGFTNERRERNDRQRRTEEQRHGAGMKKIGGDGNRRQS
jgi:hypothetical protein